MKLKDKANFQFCGQAGKILENANYNFLASVTLTKDKQAFRMQADVALLGEVDCPGSTQCCSACCLSHGRGAAAGLSSSPVTLQPYQPPTKHIIQEIRDGKKH